MLGHFFSQLSSRTPSISLTATLMLLSCVMFPVLLLKSLKNLNSLLSAFKDVTSITRIHALLIVLGLSANRNSGCKLISSYARLGDLLSAQKVFEQLPHRGVDAWNALVIAHSRKGLANEVVGLYQRMVTEGVRPDSPTLTVAVRACVSLEDVGMGEQIWRQAAYFGYKNDVFVGSSVLNLYAKCGKMDEAMVIFERMPRRDLVCWTTMITGLATNGQPREAIDVYRKMQREGIEGDEVIVVGLIQACVDLRNKKLGLSVHGYMIRKQFDRFVVAQTCLLVMYAKYGFMEQAYCVFKRMQQKSDISWGALISGFAQNGFAEHTLQLFIQMQVRGFKPESTSLVSALLACAQIGLLKLGKSIHGYITRRLDHGQVSGTALIDMYAKCGALSCAQASFNTINCRDLISWNSLIATYGSHGLGNEALSVFHKMIKLGLKPDHATFAAILSALSHSGLVKEGQYWFRVMVSEYNIQPTDKHYACIIDLLARAGLVEEAYKLIKSTETKLGLAVWGALLSGCYNHRKVLVGKIAAKKILEMNPDDSGMLQLVSNFFAMTNKWDEVAQVRKVMKETVMKKVPGYSMVDANGEFHVFLMGDKRHDKLEDIEHVLGKLNSEMRSHAQVERPFILFQG